MATMRLLPSSTQMTYFLLAVYAYIAVASVFEHNWNRLEYWTGALLIVHSTLRTM